MKNATGLASGSDKAMFGSLMNTASSITGVQNNGILGTLKGLFSNSKAGSYLGNVGSAFGEVKNNAIVSSITNGFKQAGGFIKMGFGGLGSGFGQLFSMAGSGIANSKVGQFVGGAASKIGGFMGSVGGGLKTGASMLANSSIGKLGGSMLNLSTTMLSPVTSMFGGILSGALPVVGVVSGIIALFSILGDNLDGIRGLVESVFGEAGVKVFDSFTGGLKNILGFIKNIFNGGLAAALAPVKKMILNLFGGNEAPAVVGKTFDSIVNIVQSALGVIGQLVDFSVNYIKPIILNVFNFIVNTVMPIILNIFNTVAPIISSLITKIGSAVMNVATIIAEAIQFIWPLIEGVITVVLNIAEVVIPMALAAFNVLWETISSVVDGIKNIFEGVIQFITGIFSGEWKKAWEGIKNIFGGIFETLGALFKAPINVIITLINKAISGINNLGIEIPDWVPFLGGKKFGLDISEIPLLAKGGFTNGPAIAGEAGTEAVISFARSVRKKNLDTWLTAGQMLGVDFGGAVKELKKIDTGGMGGNITFAPQITINGNADERTVDYMVDQMRDMFEEWFENKVRRQARTAY
jgi:phage-related protein